MKRAQLFKKALLAALLALFVMLGSGCGSWSQLGESTSEGARRHKRISRINRQELNADIDTLLLLDSPSKLTDKRIP